LEAHRERDFADSQLSILQQITRFAEAYAGDVINKVYACHLFEFFAQVIGAHVDGLRDSRQRKLLIRMLADEFSRFPDLHWLGPFPASGADLPDLICGRHRYHPASADFGRDQGAPRPLAIARLILAPQKNQTLLVKQFLQSKSQSVRSRSRRHCYFQDEQRREEWNI